MTDSRVPDPTLKALARTLFVEGRTYGFGFQDYVRFVNHVLDLAMAANERGDLEEHGTLPLRGTKVHIRACTPEDLPRLRDWITAPEGRYFLLSRGTREPMDVERILEDPSSAVGVITLPDETPVGAVLYIHIDRDQKTGELRKIIGEPGLRGRGIGTEASRLWVGYGLRGLGLTKINLYTLASNFRNVRLNEHLGFRVEGILRDGVFFDGRQHDLLHMGLTAAETP